MKTKFEESKLGMILNAHGLGVSLDILSKMAGKTEKEIITRYTNK